METPDVYPLTGLQIGDIQSYVSQAFLYVSSRKRLFVMVDNRPWSVNKQSKSTRIWQLMVTKYRMSPFMNTRAAQKTLAVGFKDDRNDDYESYFGKLKKGKRWLPLVDSSKLQEKYFHAVMSLNQSLHGFIVFEVAWKDVHGINYLNELQTDTYLALEVRTMRKWEFFDPEHASSCITLWFSECISETQPLKDFLKKLSDFDQQSSSCQSPTNQEVSSLDDPFEDNFLDVQEVPFAVGDLINGELCDKENADEKKPLVRMGKEDDASISPAHYSDTLILFRFNDSLLPFKLNQIIMSDIRLLTLLESGLPSWVIFFQSYPLFCYIYRPWMRLLVRTVHILISLVTVLVGFYDLYKNVPLLKATAARLCGPFFDWIETWDMVTRLRYLGTMFFLQNIQRSLNWLLLMARTTKALVAVISKPLLCPLGEIIEFISPLLNIFVEISEFFYSTVWSVVNLIYTMVTVFAEVFLRPFELVYNYLHTTATLLLPIFGCIWEIFLFPVRCSVTFATCALSLVTKIYYLLKDIWETISSTFEFSFLSETEQSSFDSSALKDLWNDLFSQVFRAIRSIINGFAAFFISCNRHRLSLYNHICALPQHLTHSVDLTWHRHRLYHRHREAHEPKHSNKEPYHECDHCK
ncbi:uncharacterized protein LOC122055742 isoform X1 [Zingiber officinale]|uniref:Uncharacterized protein n=3 Tax=Zingiber officinale TaxID=94328 RepID=A0A8J5GZ96_ZINOF|nr:uncharacterized protein LOC122055742 isoform X1 [Zingiber officinale]XP_042473263.1 uncharacterized protein LOC122055742 isoform X1 [Zingiber officinale]KAG6517331.1 hypothetical protein ZIOFF_020716 [Zingiber officinale]